MGRKSTVTYYGGRGLTHHRIPEKGADGLKIPYRSVSSRLSVSVLRLWVNCTNHQQMMAAGGGDLERALGALLALDVAQVEPTCRRGVHFRRGPRQDLRAA